MPLVYAVVHNGYGDFMICMKNQRGYFFHNKNGPGGKTFQQGRFLRGGGFRCFPGGTPDLPGVIAGALEELEEETGIILQQGQAVPQYYSGVSGQYQYYGVYFDVGQQYPTILNTMATNLYSGQQAAASVAQGNFNNQYTQLRQYYAGCPMDNEVNSPVSWNLILDHAQIAALSTNQATDWFYNIIMNLQQQLFPVTIQELNGQPAGFARSITQTGGQYLLDGVLYNPALLLPVGQYNILYAGNTYQGLTPFPPLTPGGPITFS